MLLARLDARRDAGLLERRLELRADLGEKLLLIAARFLQRPLDDAVALRIEGAEAEILELELHGVEPEPLGHRRIDVERLARDEAPLGRRQRLDGAQVMGAVGELDQDDAQVAHHREQHLAEVLGLRFLAVLEADLIELGDPVDDLGHIVAEAAGDVGLGDRGVLDDIVQDRAHDGVGIQMQLGEDLRRRDRVGDVGLARDARLALVGGGAELGGFADALDLLGAAGRCRPWLSSSLTPGVPRLAPGSNPNSEDA